MHVTCTVSASLFALLLADPSMALASIHTPRQNGVLAVGDACQNLTLKDGLLHATCNAPNTVFKDTSMDLNQCLTNDRGVLKFTTRYLSLADTAHVSTETY
jgi:hypothetical protein